MSKLKQGLQSLASLKLTITCLLFLIVLTIAGTLEQKNLGLFLACEKYFYSVFLWIPLGPISVPFVGAYVVMAVFFCNLLAAFLVKFRWHTQRLGLLVSHIVFFLLLIGSFITFHYSEEGSISIAEGNATSVMTSYHQHEISIIETTHRDYDKFTSFSNPTTNKTLQASHLPFHVQIEAYYPNVKSSAFLWQTPTNWFEKPNSAPGGIVQFSLHDTTSCTLSFLTGHGGGILPNLNRWRRQMGMAEQKNLDVEKQVKIDGHTGVWVDLQGSFSSGVEVKENYRMLGAIVSSPDGMIFFKMIGDVDEVSQEEKKLRSWISSFEFAKNSNTGIFPEQKIALQPQARDRKNEQNTPAVNVSLYQNKICLGTANLHSGKPLHFQFEGRHFNLLLDKVRYEMPFQIGLIDFQKESYPGSAIAKSFQSEVEIVENGLSRNVTISMNRPLRYRGYTFYQSSFDQKDNKTVSTFAVVKNPAEAWPYFSCLLIFLGMLIHFVEKLLISLRRERKKSDTNNSESKTSSKKWLAAAAIIFSTVLWFFGDVPSNMQTSLVQHQGRVQPMDSLARGLLLQISGRTYVKEGKEKLSAQEWFLATLLSQPETREQKIFLVENPEVLEDLNIPYTRARDRYSYNTLRPAIPHLRLKAKQIQNIEAEDRTLVQNQIFRLCRSLIEFEALAKSFSFWHPVTLSPKAKEIIQRDAISIWEMRSYIAKNLTSNSDNIKFIQQEMNHAIRHHYSSFFRAFPSQFSETWRSPWEIFVNSYITCTNNEGRHYLDAWLELYNSKRSSHDWQTVVKHHQEILESEQGKQKAGMEVRYNQLSLFNYALAIYILSFLFCAFSWMGSGGLLSYKIAGWLMFLGYILHSNAICMRMYIKSRPPVTNLYESILFVAWVSVSLAFFLEVGFRRRMRSVGILVGSTLGAILLFVAGRYSLDGSQLEVLVAVLDSNFWLATHVTTITIGYSACLVAGLIGHFAILLTFTSSETQKKYAPELQRMMYGTLGFATLFAFLGTILGGLWADQSWGRFWGWDPKENGALLIVLWNAVLLHARLGGFIRQRGMALGVIFGNVIVAAAWWGVNLLSIGLHNYGFTTGLFTNLVIFALVEISFIVLGFVRMKKT